MGRAGTVYTGRGLPRREDVRILRGRSRFVDDVDVPGAAHVAFVRSPHAAAAVTAIRPPAGVTAITAADLAGLRPLPIQRPDGAEVADEPHPLLAGDEVRYVGQPVAAVIAPTRALAEDAAELVEVDYEPGEPVLDPRASGHTLAHFHRVGGDVAGAFAAAHRVVRARHVIPRLVAAPMEPRGAIASYDEAADLLTLWSSTQDPHRPRAHLAAVLDRSPERIRVVVPDVGGAFGSKGPLAPEAAVVAATAIALRTPLRWTEDRRENFLAAYQGRGMDAEVELALSRDGEILGLRAEILADVGAYLHPPSVVPQHTMAMLMTGCYAIPAAEVEAIGVRTNKVPTGPYRGAGRPEAAYAVERTIDVAARELGVDPVELRRRNLVRDFPYATPLGFTYDSGDFERCLDRALELVEPEADGDRLVGTGVALYVERAGGQWESASARVEGDGRIVVEASSSPHGQGHETTFAQLAADRLGVAPEDVEVRFGNVPGVGTFGSRSTAVAGSAVVRAIEALVSEGRIAAAGRLGEGVELAGGRFVAGGRSLSLGELAPLRAEARFGSELVFSSGAYAAVVEIDRATGAVRVLRIAAVDDAGRIMNPLLAEGQVIGGTVQGLGAALVEAAEWDESGQPTTTSFADYSLLTAAEVPPIRSAFVETPSPLNPLGAKGIGEGGTIGAPAAVANAVADALGGGVGLDPPFTAERVWRALGERGEAVAGNGPAGAGAARAERVTSPGTEPGGVAGPSGPVASERTVPGQAAGPRRPVALAAVLAALAALLALRLLRRRR